MLYKIIGTERRDTDSFFSNILKEPARAIFFNKWSEYMNKYITVVLMAKQSDWSNQQKEAQLRLDNLTQVSVMTEQELIDDIIFLAKMCDSIYKVNLQSVHIFIHET